MRPKLFIGSSVEGLHVAYAAQENLQHEAEVIVWPQGVFSLSKTALESLLAALDRMDFGIFVFTPDDLVTIRGEESRAIRDNVILELGLFLGQLGRERSFTFMPDQSEEFRLPTDLIGMTPATYEVDRIQDEPLAATGVACNKARMVIKRLGLRSSRSSTPDTPQRDKENVGAESPHEETAKSVVDRDEKPNDDTDWWEAYKAKRYGETLTILQTKMEKADDEDEKGLYKTWIGKVKASEDFPSGVRYFENELDKDPKEFHYYLGLADIYDDNDLFEECIAILDKGIEAATKKNALRSFKASVLGEAGETERAKSLLEDVLKEEPQYGYGYETLARILQEAGQSE